MESFPPFAPLNSVLPRAAQKGPGRGKPLHMAN